MHRASVQSPEPYEVIVFPLGTAEDEILRVLFDKSWIETQDPAEIPGEVAGTIGLIQNYAMAIRRDIATGQLTAVPASQEDS